MRLKTGCVIELKRKVKQETFQKIVEKWKSGNAKIIFEVKKYVDRYDSDYGFAAGGDRSS